MDDRSIGDSSSLPFTIVLVGRTVIFPVFGVLVSLFDAGLRSHVSNVNEMEKTATTTALNFAQQKDR